jgi:hypothetical protein
MAALTNEECELVQDHLDLFAQLCGAPDILSLLKRYIEQGTPQYNGTLDAVLPHFMGIQDMRKAQRNLKILCGMAEHLIEIVKLRDEMIEQVAA